MRFAFTDDQLAVPRRGARPPGQGVPARGRARRVGHASRRTPTSVWTGASPSWACSACSCPRRTAGSGSREVDLVLLLEEAGRAALPEPLVETTAVAVPLLAEAARTSAGRWLARDRSGDAVGRGRPSTTPLVLDADVATCCVLLDAGRVALYPSDDGRSSSASRSVDGARRLFRVRLRPASGVHARARRRTRRGCARAPSIAARSARPRSSSASADRMLDAHGRVRAASASSSACRSAASRRSSTTSPTRCCSSSSPARRVPRRVLDGARARRRRRRDVSMAKAAASRRRRARRAARRCSATAPSATPSSTTCTSG